MIEQVFLLPHEHEHPLGIAGLGGRGRGAAPHGLEHAGNGPRAVEQAGGLEAVVGVDALEGVAPDELGVLEAGAKLEKELPDARAHVFEGVAHMVNLERPEEFNRIVREFLESVR